MLLNPTMQPIESIESDLPDKRKSLLRSLRSHDWQVVGVDDSDASWGCDSKWLIEATHEQKGFRVWLWFYKYAGKFDGLDRVVAITGCSPEQSSYSGQPSIEFALKHFDNRLQTFMNSLNLLRFESHVDETR